MSPCFGFCRLGQVLDRLKGDSAFTTIVSLEHDQRESARSLEVS